MSDDRGVQLPLDLRVVLRAIQHDPGGAELLAAVDDRDLRGELGQERGLLHRGVPAADDHDLLALEEEAVAGGAGGDALAHQARLGLEAEELRRGARGDDDGVGRDLAAGVERQAEGTLAELDVGHGVEHDLGPEALGLLAEDLHELGPLDAVLEARGSSRPRS